MYKTKKCPQCGALMFADMDVCYECLYGNCEEDEQVPEEAYGDVDVVARDELAEGSWCLHMSTSVVDVTMGVPKGGLIIGRGSSSDVVLHAQAVSRNHVSIEDRGSYLVARDLGAANKATVNGVVIEEEATLRKGDVLDVCGATFRVSRSF